MKASCNGAVKILCSTLNFGWVNNMQLLFICILILSLGKWYVVKNTCHMRCI